MTQDVVFTEIEKNKTKVAIFVYKGEGDPVLHLDKAVQTYAAGQRYNEFIDANMDNPWMRVIVKGIENLEAQKTNQDIYDLTEMD